VLSVPLVAGDRVLGAIVMYRDEPGPFSEEEVELLQVFAAQASIGVENAELYRRAEARRREAEVMAELARDINASLDLDIVLERVVRGARDLCAADFARIALREEGGAMRLRYGSGTRSSLWTEVRVEPGKGSGGYVLVTGRPFRTDDYLGDSRLVEPYRELATAEGTVAEMVVPIRSQDELQGVLYVTNRTARSFTDHDEAILLRLANYAGAAIRNAALYAEVRTAHETLERSQAQLVQTERLRALGEMAAGVAHDFNNLLAVILGRSELLLRRVQDPDVAQGLALVRRAAQDGADTIRRIQEFTRTRQSRPFERVTLLDVVREVVELTRPRWKDEAQSQGIQYDVVVDGDTPPIAGRPEELREVFTNLLRNALEAMPSGGRCRVTLAGGGDAVSVSVSDTGVGMSDDVRRRVFEPFFTSKGPRGSGLGLAVSWSIVSRHGGTIEVQSAPGRGSTFTVRLPIPSALPGAHDPANAGIVAGSARILIIDDEPEVRGVLADMLTEAGFTVAKAADGVAGLRRCEQERFDLVLTDISMPALSGWDVAAACRQRFPALPIGLVTGWGDQLDPERVGASGIKFVIAKPFRADEVVQEIAKALGRSDAL
jgi:signal transduction histidine kinase/ActR/RegA family two-component response regulator